MEDGGGLYGTGAPRIEISRGKFEGNRAAENGGGVRVSYATRLRAEDVRFVKNESNAVGAQAEGGGGLAARNAEVTLVRCDFERNVARLFAGGAVYLNSAWEGGFWGGDFYDPWCEGQFDDIMEQDYGLTNRRYTLADCTARDNVAGDPACTAPASGASSSGAGGFLYAVRVPAAGGQNRGGRHPLVLRMEGSKTKIEPNCSDWQRPGHPGGLHQKRGNVVIELSGSGRDRVFLGRGIDAASIAASSIPVNNASTVVLPNDGSATGYPPPFPYVYGPAPTVNDVQPRAIPAGGGTELTVTGAEFEPGARVLVGGRVASGVNFDSTRKLRASAPAGPAGSAQVVVENPDEQRATFTAPIRYVSPPTIIDVQPRVLSRAGGTELTITGADFDAGAVVRVGRHDAADIRVDSPTTLRAKAPAGATGPVQLVVENPDKQQATFTGSVRYVPPPTLQSVQPGAGPVAGNTTVRLTGTNFLAGVKVSIGTKPAANVKRVSAKELTATTPAGDAVGAVDVIVTNPDGASATKASAFRYEVPS